MPHTAHPLAIFRSPAVRRLSRGAVRLLRGMLLLAPALTAGLCLAWVVLVWPFATPLGGSLNGSGGSGMMGWATLILSFWYASIVGLLEGLLLLVMLPWERLFGRPASRSRATVAAGLGLGLGLLAAAPLVLIF
jgi:hypothetical protein